MCVCTFFFLVSSSMSHFFFCFLISFPYVSSAYCFSPVVASFLVSLMLCCPFFLLLLLFCLCFCSFVSSMLLCFFSHCLPMSRLRSMRWNLLCAYARSLFYLVFFCCCFFDVLPHFAPVNKETEVKGRKKNESGSECRRFFFPLCQFEA